MKNLKLQNGQVKKKSKGKFFSFLITLSLLLSVPTGISASAEKLGTDTPCDENSSPNDVEVSSRFFELIFGKGSKREKAEDIFLCPGGDAFGVKICTEGVSVEKVVTELSSGLLREGDIILKIDGKAVSSISEVKSAVNASGGEELEIEIMRGSKKTKLAITPSSAGGEYHLGVILSDGASGIGTITYYNPKSREFGGLGHGICSSDGKEVLKMTEGKVTGALIAGAKRGAPSKPGELRGVLTDKILGTVSKNTECGVFGTLNENAPGIGSEPIKIAARSEVTEGEATIISTVKSGKKCEYKIEITDIDYNSHGTKSFKIHVTDDTLIALTGGIVRGMSGSPIIQDGKLIGAVTHVMVADPTEGYGIFIENMLSAAEMTRQRAA